MQMTVTMSEDSDILQLMMNVVTQYGRNFDM